ncbi:unnamed protein product [Penicillium egyptiacum]|uniref:Uncharacterized protein n=1 Tax=Penicillium egyptiacum TaxID=1303716 RepID=A0A9W4P852_9EURO|nr:unnamed protein product [Penicillium egyptiacum]
MQEKSASNGGAQFSAAELRDLFRLDEDRACQTHELLGCRCGGRGVQADSEASSSGAVTPATVDGGGGSEVEDLSDPPSDLDDGDDDYDSDDSLPKPHTLVKASEVDMEKQEQSIRDGTYRARMAGKGKKGNKKEGDSRTQKDKMHQSLAQYSHIDPTLLATESGSNNAAGVGDEELEAAIDDDVLVSMLKDECNLVGYVFKKSNGAEMRS